MKLEGENKGMVALFERNFKGLASNSLEGEDEDQRGTKTLLIHGARVETEIWKCRRLRRIKHKRGARKKPYKLVGGYPYCSR